MCNMCVVVDPVQEDCVFTEGGGVASLESDTGSSAIPSISTADLFSGSLMAGEQNWIEVYLEAGTAYSFDMLGAASGAGTLEDSTLTLRDDAGELVAYDDDSGLGLDARIAFTPATSGTYYIGAGSYQGTASGSYVLSMATEVGTVTTAAATLGTLNQMANYLVSGYWVAAGGAAHNFDTSSSNVITYNLTGLTAAGQQLARWALEAWEFVADLEFVETTGTARLTFDDAAAGAYSNYSYYTNTGYTAYANVNVSTAWLSNYGTTMDGYSFQTYIHEIGHALGLGHQGYYNGSADYPDDAVFTNDSWQTSVMSYFSQTENTSVDASFAYVTTAMMVDIIAIQSMYGASTATAGSTIWGLGANMGGYLQDLWEAIIDGTASSIYRGSPVAMTIYDNGGYDTLDVSFYDGNQNVSLVQESFSDIAGLTGNLGIARGTMIERAITGAGNDTIVGNNANNRLIANGGNDVVSGGNGNDVLLGGNGNDRLYGNFDNDTLYGQNGNDTLDGGMGDDSVMGGSGTDSMRGGEGDDYLAGDAGDDTLNGGNGSDTVYGGADDDLLYGENGADRLFGNDGDDTLNGGNGNDSLLGGNGNDRLYGNTGNDTIRGEAGNDVVNGGWGNDALYGGAGADIFVFAPGRDVVYDFGGADRINLYSASGIDSYADLVANHLTQSNGNSLITADDGHVMVIQNVLNADLNASDFLF